MALQWMCGQQFNTVEWLTERMDGRLRLGQVNIVLSGARSQVAEYRLWWMKLKLELYMWNKHLSTRTLDIVRSLKLFCCETTNTCYGLPPVCTYHATPPPFYPHPGRAPYQETESHQPARRVELGVISQIKMGLCRLWVCWIFSCYNYSGGTYPAATAWTPCPPVLFVKICIPHF